MSEELTTSTTQGQNLAQAGSTTPIDLNFSINLHVHVTAAPALQAALERIVEALKPMMKTIQYPQQEIVFQGLTEDQAHELIDTDVIDSAMADLEPTPKTENSHALPEKKSVKSEKPRQKVKWIDVKNHPQLRYREECGKLILNYCGTNLTTTWEKIEATANVPEYLLKHELPKIAGDSAHKRAGLSLFLKLVSKGDIKVPDPNEEFEKNFKQFQTEEDSWVSA